MPRSSFTLAALLLASAVSAQTTIYTLEGPGILGKFGFDVAMLGDVDGDGRSDFVILRDTGNLVRVFSGRTGGELYQLFGDMPGDGFGDALAAAGDVNADGYADIVVGAPNHDGVAANTGLVRVFSGIDGSVLHDFLGDPAHLRLGGSVSGAGDIDGDGYDDIVAGAPFAPTAPGVQGYARVFSGFDGSVLHTFVGDASIVRFGDAVSGAGDVDGDGHVDLLVGASSDSTHPGRARVYSGLTGALILDLVGSEPFDDFGEALAPLGDIDGDGFDDFLVGARGDDEIGFSSGRVTAFSGATGAKLYSVVGDTSGDNLGYKNAVSPAGDLDGDGITDFAAGAPSANATGGLAGMVRVYSGVDGAELFTLWGEPNDQLGFSASAGGDVNGDGVPDIVAGAPANLTSEPGRVFVFSGTPLALASDGHELSLGGGGVQALELDAGAAHASDWYWILGSATGTAPGIAVGSVVLPLVPDPYFSLTLTKPFAGVFSGFLSMLDANGQASAGFQLPTGADPTLAGVTLHHAFLSAANLGDAELASNAVPVTLVP